MTQVHFILRALPFTLHLSRGSSVSGQAAFRLRSCSGQGWCSGRGWPAGSRLLALQQLRSTDAPCGPLWVKEACPALLPPGAAVWSGEPSGNSAGFSVPAGAGYLTAGAAHEGRGRDWCRGLLLLAWVWSGWDNHMDPF